MASNSAGEAVVFSEVDSERFGVRVARASVVRKNISQVLVFCATEQINLLIARCTTKDLPIAQQMEALGFLLMDTLVYYSFDLMKRAIPDDASPANVRKFGLDDKPQVETVAAAAFQGYSVTTTPTPGWTGASATRATSPGRLRSCTSKQVATEVLVAELDKKVIGFATLRLNTPEERGGRSVRSGSRSAGHRHLPLFYGEWHAVVQRAEREANGCLYSGNECSGAEGMVQGWF